MRRRAKQPVRVVISGPERSVKAVKVVKLAERSKAPTVAENLAAIVKAARRHS